MKRLFFALPGVLLLLAIFALLLIFLFRPTLDEMHIDAGEPSKQPGNYRVHIQHDGRDRVYIVHVPPGVGSAPLPLFIALHGGGSRTEVTDDLAGLTPVADREVFIVAFPQAIDKRWNDSTRESTPGEGVDDVGFIEAMIDDIAQRLPVDQKRVYAAGISNGAFMANRLACEAADRIAGVGLVAGTGKDGFEVTCKPGRPVPVIAFLSTKDPIVPFGGGYVRAYLLKWGKGVSADELVAFWAGNNGCKTPPEVTDLPDLNSRDDSTVELQAWDDCNANADVHFYRIDGAGHTWPGGRQYLSPWLVGTTNRDINATELMWSFFEERPRP